MIAYAILVFRMYYTTYNLIFKQSKKRISGGHNKHKNFNLRKKSAPVNENEVKKIKIQIHNLYM
jgi:stress response protein YsnF